MTSSFIIGFVLAVLIVGAFLYAISLSVGWKAAIGLTIFAVGATGLIIVTCMLLTGSITF